METPHQIVIPIMCDDCGKEKLAELRGNKIIIYDTRHGFRHSVEIDLEKIAGSILVALAKT